MRLEQSFMVGAPTERVWAALLDVESVASCLPGAEITGQSPNGAYEGAFTVKLGPTTAAYKGSLRMDEVDEPARRTRMSARGTDKRGQGGANATIVTTLREDGQTTVVDVVSDFTITGRLARFGRSGMMEDISRRLLADFATCLQARLLGDAAEPSPVPATLSTPNRPEETNVPESDSPRDETTSPPAPPDDEREAAAEPPAEPFSQATPTPTEAATPPDEPLTPPTPEPPPTAREPEPPPTAREPEPPPTPTPEPPAVPPTPLAADPFGPIGPAASEPPAEEEPSRRESIPPPTSPTASDAPPAKPVGGLSLFFSALGDRLKRLFGR